MPHLELLAKRNYAPRTLGSVLILGLGVSGKAAANYCLELLGNRVEHLTIYGGPSREDACEFGRACEKRGAEVFFDTEDVEGNFDICIASPGISQFSSFYINAQKQSLEVISEVEFAWREAPSQQKWVAITGTNGKSTTTALCAHVFNSAFAQNVALAVGNIGDACIDAVARSVNACPENSMCNLPFSTYVAEVSSYQLASTRLFAPDVSIMLGITPDHLAWHKSLEAYIDAKRKIFSSAGTRKGATATSYAILDATNPVVYGMVQQMHKDQQRPFIALGSPEGIEGDLRKIIDCENAAFLRGDGMLVVVLGKNEIELVRADELRIFGLHNVINALAAAAAALCLGAPVEGVREGLCSFSALEHRIEFCGEVAGVACYNDSKATNVDATLKALCAFVPKKPYVLLGGDDKGTNLDELVQTAVEHCKAVVCFGAAGLRFATAFENAPIPHDLVDSMEEALDAALSHAQEGDIVLLSPACASFDEFDNFEHRGRVFKDLVAQRQV